jgi:hypothetical protein
VSERERESERVRESKREGVRKAAERETERKKKEAHCSPLTSMMEAHSSPSPA